MLSYYIIRTLTLFAILYIRHSAKLETTIKVPAVHQSTSAFPTHNSGVFAPGMSKTSGQASKYLFLPTIQPSDFVSPEDSVRHEIEYLNRCLREPVNNTQSQQVDISTSGYASSLDVSVDNRNKKHAKVESSSQDVIASTAALSDSNLYEEKITRNVHDGTPVLKELDGHNQTEVKFSATGRLHSEVYPQQETINTNDDLCHGSVMSDEMTEQRNCASSLQLPTNHALAISQCCVHSNDVFSSKETTFGFESSDLPQSEVLKSDKEHKSEKIPSANGSSENKTMKRLQRVLSKLSGGLDGHKNRAPGARKTENSSAAIHAPLDEQYVRRLTNTLDAYSTNALSIDRDLEQHAETALKVERNMLPRPSKRFSCANDSDNQNSKPAIRSKRRYSFVSRMFAKHLYDSKHS